MSCLPQMQGMEFTYGAPSVQGQVYKLVIIKDSGSIPDA
jgi:hypothetical protein